MAWGAIISAVLALALEILKLIREVRSDKKEEAIELKKLKTEQVQRIARGIIDRDASRINAGFDELRRLREGS